MLMCLALLCVCRTERNRAALDQVAMHERSNRHSTEASKGSSIQDAADLSSADDSQASAASPVGASSAQANEGCSNSYAEGSIATFSCASCQTDSMLATSIAVQVGPSAHEVLTVASQTAAPALRCASTQTEVVDIDSNSRRSSSSSTSSSHIMNCSVGVQTISLPYNQPSCTVGVQTSDATVAQPSSSNNVAAGAQAASSSPQAGDASCQVHLLGIMPPSSPLHGFMSIKAGHDDTQPVGTPIVARNAEVSCAGCALC